MSAEQQKAKITSGLDQNDGSTQKRTKVNNLHKNFNLQHARKRNSSLFSFRQKYLKFNYAKGKASKEHVEHFSDVTDGPKSNSVPTQVFRSQEYNYSSRSTGNFHANSSKEDGKHSSYSMLRRHSSRAYQQHTSQKSNGLHGQLSEDCYVNKETKVNVEYSKGEHLNRHHSVFKHYNKNHPGKSISHIKHPSPLLKYPKKPLLELPKDVSPLLQSLSSVCLTNNSVPQLGLQNKKPLLKSPKHSVPLLEHPHNVSPLLELPTQKQPLLETPHDVSPFPQVPRKKQPLLPAPHSAPPLLELPRNKQPLLETPRSALPLLDFPRNKQPLLEVPHSALPLLDLPRNEQPLLELPHSALPLPSELPRRKQPLLETPHIALPSSELPGKKQPLLETPNSSLLLSEFPRNKELLLEVPQNALSLPELSRKKQPLLKVPYRDILLSELSRNKKPVLKVPHDTLSELSVRNQPIVEEFHNSPPLLEFPRNKQPLLPLPPGLLPLPGGVSPLLEPHKHALPIAGLPKRTLLKLPESATPVLELPENVTSLIDIPYNKHPISKLQKICALLPRWKLNSVKSNGCLTKGASQKPALCEDKVKVPVKSSRKLLSSPSKGHRTVKQKFETLSKTAPTIDKSITNLIEALFKGGIGNMAAKRNDRRYKIKKLESKASSGLNVFSRKGKGKICDSAGARKVKVSTKAKVTKLHKVVGESSLTCDDKQCTVMSNKKFPKFLSQNEKSKLGDKVSKCISNSDMVTMKNKTQQVNSTSDIGNSAINKVTRGNHSFVDGAILKSSKSKSGKLNGVSKNAASFKVAATLKCSKAKQCQLNSNKGSKIVRKLDSYKHSKTELRNKVDVPKDVPAYVEHNSHSEISSDRKIVLKLKRKVIKKEISEVKTSKGKKYSFDIIKNKDVENSKEALSREAVINSSADDDNAGKSTAKKMYPRVCNSISVPDKVQACYSKPQRMEILQKKRRKCFRGGRYELDRNGMLKKRKKLKSIDKDAKLGIKKCGNGCESRALTAEKISENSTTFNDIGTSDFKVHLPKEQNGFPSVRFQKCGLSETSPSTSCTEISADPEKTLQKKEKNQLAIERMSRAAAKNNRKSFFIKSCHRLSKKKKSRPFAKRRKRKLVPAQNFAIQSSANQSSNPSVSKRAQPNKKAATHSKSASPVYPPPYILYDKKTMSAIEDHPIEYICACENIDTESDVIDSASISSVCEAVDDVNGYKTHCTDPVLQLVFLRSSANLPYQAVCEKHFWLIKNHQSCPGCGEICLEGKFLTCIRRNPWNYSAKMHFFHHKCLRKFACPHCGCSSKFESFTLTAPASPKSPRKKPALKLGDNSTGPKVIWRTESLDSSTKNNHPEKTAAENISTFAKRVSLYSNLKFCDPSVMYRAVKHAKLKSKQLANFQPSKKKFHSYLKVGDLEKVVELLSCGIDPNVRYTSPRNDTALHIAAFMGYINVVCALVEAGAIVDSLNDDLATPLMLAVKAKHILVVKYLVIAGANISARDDMGMTPLHVAACTGDVNIMDLVFQGNNVEINAQDDGGWTPLIWACEHRHLDIANFLLERNADPHIKDNEGNSALHWSAVGGETKIAKALLLRDCAINTLNKDEESALHVAARNGHLQIAQFLISQGAQADLRNTIGLSPAMCCPKVDSEISRVLHRHENICLKEKEEKKPIERILLRDLSNGREACPVEVLSDLNRDKFNCNFHYITQTNFPKGVAVNKIVKSRSSCRCRSNCSGERCSCSKLSLKLWYGNDGCLTPDFNMESPPVIFECSKMCRCPQTCCNRVIQHGIKCHLQVFRSRGRGWGLRTVNAIKCGTFICEYVGELVKESEIKEQGKDCYLFELNSEDSSSYCLDARSYGNVSRFLNHSCDPNLIAVKAFIDHQDLNFPHVAFFSNRYICANEELCIDYGDSFWMEFAQKLICVCRSSNCRYSVNVRVVT